MACSVRVFRVVSCCWETTLTDAILSPSPLLSLCAILTDELSTRLLWPTRVHSHMSTRRALEQEKELCATRRALTACQAELAVSREHAQQCAERCDEAWALLLPHGGSGGGALAEARGRVAALEEHARRCEAAAANSRDALAVLQLVSSSEVRRMNASHAAKVAQLDEELRSVRAEVAQRSQQQTQTQQPQPQLVAELWGLVEAQEQIIAELLAEVSRPPSRAPSPRRSVVRTHAC